VFALAEPRARDLDVNIAREVDAAGDEEAAVFVLAHVEAIEASSGARSVDEIE
jgi:hypothetical protein